MIQQTKAANPRRAPAQDAEDGRGQAQAVAEIPLAAPSRGSGTPRCTESLTLMMVMNIQTRLNSGMRFSHTWSGCIARFCGLTLRQEIAQVEQEEDADD